MTAPQPPDRPERSRRHIRPRDCPEPRKVPRTALPIICLALFAVVLTLVDDELCH